MSSKSATEDNSNKCRILELPAELRNRIYRYTLLTQEESVRIESPTTFTQPGLLRSCKRIRNEASSIYYLENGFNVSAPDFDHRLLAAFEIQSSYVHGDEQIQVGVYLHAQSASVTSWSKMVTYIKAYLNDEVRYPINCGDNPWCEAHACGAARWILKLVKLRLEEHQASWEELESMMEIMKEMAEQQAQGRWKWT